MGIKRTKKTKATVKTSAKSRTLNPANASRPVEGAPSSHQDLKRRSGNFEGTGEFTRGGVRGK
jgi:hypothetical protein